MTYVAKGPTWVKFEWVNFTQTPSLDTPSRFSRPYNFTTNNTRIDYSFSPVNYTNSVLEVWKMGGDTPVNSSFSMNLEQNILKGTFYVNGTGEYYLVMTLLNWCDVTFYEWR